MEESTTPRRLSRRTIAKGAAWTVPAVAVAAPAAAAATSPVPPPPPPTIDFGGACASTGSGQGCSGQVKALQVPVTLNNSTDSDLLFVVEGAWSINENNFVSYPEMMPTPGSSGSGFGFFGLGTSGSDCAALVECVPSDLESGCLPTECDSISPIASSSSKVLVRAGECVVLWYAFFSTGDNASAFMAKVWFTWYDPETCMEVGVGTFVRTDGATPSNNCHPNFSNPTGNCPE